MPQDIYSQLETDHRTIEQLFDECERQSGEGHRATFEKLAGTILSHAKAEEETFYAKLSSLGEKIEHAYEEHEEASNMIEACRGAIGDDEQFMQLLHELKEAIGHHVDEEEGTIFDEARKILAGQEDMIGGEFEEKVRELRERPATSREEPAASPPR